VRLTLCALHVPSSSVTCVLVFEDVTLVSAGNPLLISPVSLLPLPTAAQGPLPQAPACRDDQQVSSRSASAGLVEAAAGRKAAELTCVCSVQHRRLDAGASSALAWQPLQSVAESTENVVGGDHCIAEPRALTRPPSRLLCRSIVSSPHRHLAPDSRTFGGIAHSHSPSPDHLSSGPRTWRLPNQSRSSWRPLTAQNPTISRA